MSRSFFGTQVSRVMGGSANGVRRPGRRSRVRSHVGIEALEERRLLADSIIPSAVITSTPGRDFKYDITLTNSAASNAPIGTFWYAWIPGEDFLATSPISVTPPTGWVDNITHTTWEHPAGRLRHSIYRR